MLLSTLLSTTAAFGDDKKVRRVIVISLDGMHSLDLALWTKNHPTSALAQLSARGMNYTNASTTKPSDSIPGTVGMFTGGSPAVAGMYYDDAWHRGWFAPSNTTCTGAPGTVVDLKQGINLNLDGTGGVDPLKMPRQLVNGVCTPVLPHNMMRVNTIFEVLKLKNNRTAYSEKRPAYEFLNGPSGTGVDDLYTPEIACTPFVPPSTCTDALRQVATAKAFDELRVVSVLNEIDGKDHTGTQNVDVPTLFGMNFQSVNAAKKDSLRGGYADDMGTPNSSLDDALTYIDGALGRMTARLEANGLTGTTAIIITAKHGETSIDPSKRFVELTSAIQTVLTANGFPATKIKKLTEKSTAYIWLTNQADTTALTSILTTAANEQSLNIAQILSNESLKLLFPDPLSDPAPPDVIIVPNPGTNYEPTLNTALPAVQAEHGGMNENDLHIPLLVVVPSLPHAVYRAPVTTTQIAPSILNLLNIDSTKLDAVRLEGTRTLPGISSKKDGDDQDNNQ
jgi:hypothetical protein